MEIQLFDRKTKKIENIFYEDGELPTISFLKGSLHIVYTDRRVRLSFTDEEFKSLIEEFKDYLEVEELIKQQKEHPPRHCKVCGHTVACSDSGALVWHDKDGKEQEDGDMELSCRGSRT